MADADADLTEWTARAAAALSFVLQTEVAACRAVAAKWLNDTAAHAGEKLASDQPTGAS